MVQTCYLRLLAVIFNPTKLLSDLLCSLGLGEDLAVMIFFFWKAEFHKLYSLMAFFFYCRASVKKEGNVGVFAAMATSFI